MADSRAARNARLRLLAALEEIDRRKVRALTDAVLAAQDARLQALETEAEGLRQQLRDLGPP